MTSAETRLDDPLRQTIYLLGEHLDMILAAGEDLKRVVPEWRPVSTRRAADPRICLKQFAARVHTYECAAIARIERAREHTRRAVRLDKRLAMLGGLFVAGTAALSDAVAAMADSQGRAFDTGSDPISYLTSRGIVDPEAGLPADLSTLTVTDDFRIAGVIELGPLMDLSATFLDTLDLHFDVFPAGGTAELETAGSP